MHLPGKIKYIFILTCILFFGLFFYFPEITRAENSQDRTFNPSAQEWTEENQGVINSADCKGDKLCITSSFANRRLLLDTFLNTADQIITICPQNDINNPQECSNQKSALHNISQIITLAYANPPASGIAYTQDLLANAGILAKPAYAQGIGFVALTPLLPIWKAARNISYVVLIIVMVAIGFMIIFRTKIDPKTVITVQAALPKVILTMIIITFSYPIVGFMIDLMYLSMAIVINILSSALNRRDLTTNMGFITGGGLGSIFSIGWGLLFTKFIPPPGPGLAVGGVAGIVGGILGHLKILHTFAFFGPIGGAVTGGIVIVGGLILLIYSLALLYTYIRILLILFNSYVQILLTVILGPLILLTEAIPGKSAFGGWILNIIANLVVFPATVAILLFADYISTRPSTENIWNPPLLGVINAGSSFHAFVAISIIFMLPTLVAQIKKAFHPQTPLPLTAGTAFTPVTGGAQTAMGVASQFYYLQHMPLLNKLFGQKTH